MQVSLLAKKGFGEVLRKLREDPVVFDDAWNMLCPFLKKRGVYVNIDKVEVISVDRNGKWVEIYTHTCRIFVDEDGVMVYER